MWGLSRPRKGRNWPVLLGFFIDNPADSFYISSSCKGIFADDANLKSGLP
jgi:hypothetical protein